MKRETKRQDPTLIEVGKLRRLAVLGSIVAASGLVGCDPPPPAPSAQPGEREARVSTPETVATAAMEPLATPADPKARPPTLGVQLHEIRRIGDVVEIEVALDRPLAPMGSVRPSLQVGDEITQRSRAGAEGRLDRLIFLVDAEQFGRMPQDAGLVIRAGMRSNDAADAKPRLADVSVRLVGDLP